MLVMNRLGYEDSGLDVKKTLRRICFGLPIIMLVGCLGITRAHGQDYSNRIRTKTKHPLAGLFNPHVSPVHVLIIDGKRFENVRGVKQFYLPVPGTNAVVFISDEKNYSVTYHVYDMDRSEDIAIHGKGTVFGRSIGEAACCDTVEMANGAIVLCSVERGARSTLPELADLESVKSFYYLDLKGKIVVMEKELYFDKKGKVILERNYPTQK